MNWNNLFVLIIAVCLVIPIIWDNHRRKNKEIGGRNIVGLIEQCLLFAAILSIVFNIGIDKLGFSSVESFLIWIVVMIVLTTVYFMLWLRFAKCKNNDLLWFTKLMQSSIFIYTGIVFKYLILIILGILFALVGVYCKVITKKESQ